MPDTEPSGPDRTHAEQMDAGPTGPTQRGVGPRNAERSDAGPSDAEPSDAEPSDIEPLDVDGVGAIAVGTVLWSVAFVVLLVLRDRLAEAGTEWWLWVCAAGALLGLPGLWIVTRRRAAYRRAGRRG
ncbi:MAG: DUF2530 domain-containing protein [Candidatus Nanopelagicales bacterium]